MRHALRGVTCRPVRKGSCEVACVFDPCALPQQDFLFGKRAFKYLRPAAGGFPAKADRKLAAVYFLPARQGGGPFDHTYQSGGCTNRSEKSGAIDDLLISINNNSFHTGFASKMLIISRLRRLSATGTVISKQPPSPSLPSGVPGQQ